MATTENGVYYQDDYTKIADILADMEKMAESIDVLIEKTKYDDKDIKKDIKTIQDEQKVQNDDIENIQTKDTEQDKLIQKLQSNMIQESTEEATNLYVADTSDLPAVLTIEGNHYQETQEGTDNLAVLNEGSITQDGITVSVQNGVATVSGTNTNNEATYITIGTAYLYANKTYYLRKEQGTAIGGYSLYKNGQTKWFEATGESSIDISETGEWSVRYSIGANASVSGTLKFGVYENAGTEYVVGKKAIPSLEYPSKIETVKDNIKIIQCNKNLFKITVSDNNYKGIKLTVNQEEGYASATGTSTGYSSAIGTIKLKPGDYVFSGGPTNGDWNKQRLTIYIKNSEGVFESVTTIYKNNTYVVHLDEEKEYKLNYVIPTGITVTDEKIYPQVEKGTVATDFVKQQQKEYTLPIQQEMLEGDYFDLERGKEVHHFHKYVSTSADNWILTTDIPNRFRLDTNITSQNNALNNTNQCCSHSNICYAWASPDKSFQARKDSIYFKTTDFSTAEEFNQFVAEQEEAGTPLTFYYECEEYELDLTEEQKQVLNQLNNLELFKGVNNIYTEQDLALLQLDYTVDTKMYIDKKIANTNAQVLNM